MDAVDAVDGAEAAGVVDVVELRQYTLHPGTRDTLIELFEREFVTGQEDCGIRVGPRFRDLDGTDRFVWLRAFSDMDVRKKSLTDFYDGPVWAQHRDEANATMIDSDDVLLLRGTQPQVPDGAELVVATIVYPVDPDEFEAAFELRIRPVLASTGTPPLAALRTTRAVNNFPRLPVRTEADAFVWFTAHERVDEDPWVASREARAYFADTADLRRETQTFRLAPVQGEAGSAL
ncbi:NIPSNAP family protein [Yinghuangia soli]|uniref:NIPSNAP family protein n=1 Tax=Yinghuangia soli TaxID=2908204 RepID=A0AA41TZU6_9ACTN|nr:NIPSNAP family protein [Yinghuangia soli]MCF2527685.1 NIPSNAP family protein [Yinghuangia soli]